MTRKEIRAAGKAVNQLVSEGRQILREPEYTERLLSISTKDILMQFGCRFVRSFHNYMEVPYRYIEDSMIEAVALLNGDDNEKK